MAVEGREDLLDMGSRACLVTGAGQGVGREICLRLAQHGARGVAVNDFFPDRAESVADEVRSYGCRAIPVPADVGDHAGVERMVRAAEEEFDGIEVLVNNAGNFGPDRSAVDYTAFWETPVEMWHHWLDVNLYGVMNCTHATLDGMVARGKGGRIITIISEAARVGDRNFAVYAAAKAGAAGLMRSIAREAAPFGITANNIGIGATRTPATEEGLTPELENRLARRYPIGRVGEPEDVANMALFLASDASSWITGQMILVNGGFTFSL
ncbi:MAG: SDR family NAD(P)-dependent oxidoreductase [bacterium]|nr:SDR family NAD(P)-dependent oxidoreductase [bacterium]